MPENRLPTISGKELKRSLAHLPPVAEESPLISTLSSGSIAPDRRKQRLPDLAGQSSIASRARQGSGPRTLAKLKVSEADVCVDAEESRRAVVVHAGGPKKPKPKPDPNVQTPEEQRLLAKLHGDDIDVVEVTSLLDEAPQACNARMETFGWSPLMFACNIGNLQLVKALVKVKAKIQATCSQGNTAIHLAARGGHAELVNYLISKNAQLDAQNDNGWTPLIWSSVSGHCEVASVLLLSGAQVNVPDGNGRTASMWAARHGYSELLQLLLRAGVNLRQTDASGQSLFDHAMEHVQLQDAITSLQLANNGMSDACKTNDIAAAMKALDEGAQVNFTDSDGFPPLLAAVMYGAAEVAQLLVQHGATVRPEQAEEVLGSAMQVNHVLRSMLEANEQLIKASRENIWSSAMEALLEKKAFADFQEENRNSLRTALHWAANHGADSQVFHHLVEARADLEKLDCLGWNPLLCAVQTGQLEAVSLLSHFGANFMHTSYAGDTAMHVAGSSNSPAMLQLLAAARVKLEETNSDGYTPLQVSAERGCAASVSTLLILKADASKTDNHGRSAFALAVINDHLAAAMALVRPVERPPRPSLDDGEADTCHPSEHKMRLGHSQLRKNMTPASSVCSKAGSSNSTRAAETSDEDSDADDDNQSIASVNDSDGTCPSQPATPRSEVSSVVTFAENSPRGSIASVASKRSNPSRRKPTKSPRSQTRRRAPAAALAPPKAILRRQVSKESSGSSVVEVSATPGSSRSARVSHSPSRRPRGPATMARSSRKKTASKTGAKAVVSQGERGLLVQAGILNQGLPQRIPPLHTASSALATTDQDGRAPLLLAAAYGRTDMLGELLKMKAPVDAQDNNGLSALMAASRRADILSVEALLAAGANPHLVDSNGTMAIDMTEEERIQTLLRESVERSVVQRRVRTPSDAAALSSSKSSPALLPVTPGGAQVAPGGARVRIEPLPVHVSVDLLDTQIRTLLKRRGYSFARLEIATDPITGHPLGFARVDFVDAQLAETVAEERGGRLMGGSLRIILETRGRPLSADGVPNVPCSPNKGNSKDSRLARLR